MNTDDLRAALIAELVKTRQDSGLTQRELEAISGVQQPQIARMEKPDANPKVDSLMKILTAMGKTLAIVPIKTR